jgi:hypothetical protein
MTMLSPKLLHAAFEFFSVSRKRRDRVFTI